jgi:DNA-binding transcriptional MocR family regulator
LPEYRARRDALEASLREQLPSGIGWKRPGAGLLLWVPLPASVDPQAVFEAAREEGVLVMPSSMTRASDASESGVRLTFCAEPVPRLQEGARLFGKALKRVLKQSDRDRVELGAVAVI